MLQEQARTPRLDRTRAHKRRPGSPAEFRLPADRWRLSPSLLRIGHWFLDFRCPGPSHACAGLHPSRRFAVRGMRFPNLSSIEYCRPSAVRRLEILPMTGRSDPTAAWPRHPRALCLANSYYCSSTVEAESLPVGRSKQRVFVPEADRDRARSAQLKNPTPAVRVLLSVHRSLWSSSPAIALAAPTRWSSVRDPR
jgi:hypothetical protein